MLSYETEYRSINCVEERSSCGMQQSTCRVPSDKPTFPGQRCCMSIGWSFVCRYVICGRNRQQLIVTPSPRQLNYICSDLQAIAISEMNMQTATRLNKAFMAMRILTREYRKRSNKNLRLLTACYSTASMDISGVYPPIATPFNADESVAYDKLEYNLSKWNKIPLKGYVVQGSNGEYAFLSPQERVEMVQRLVEMVPPDKLVIAGAGCESTRDTVEMCNNMADAGARAVMVVTPCYYKSQMTDSALEHHFLKVAGSSKVPVILYSVPGNTGIDLSQEVVIRLSQHPNIIGLKDSAGDIAKLANIVYKTSGNNFQVLAGSASFLYPAYAVGCVGGVCALANVLGQELCELEKLFKERKNDEARLLQHRLIGPNACVTKMFGVPGLKKAMEWLGYYGGPTRSPLLPLNQSQEKTIKEVFRLNGFLT
ncbi:hypothetical protein ScPMuIL_001234 [Solemya velum]